MKQFSKFSSAERTSFTVIGLGVFFRLFEYFSSRSLWVDEAFLANNIIQNSFFNLVKPLTDNQHAPIGFLLVEKLLTYLLGTSEEAFRLFPLLCSCISLILFYLLVKRIFQNEWVRVIGLS